MIFNFLIHLECVDHFLFFVSKFVILSSFSLTNSVLKILFQSFFIRQVFINIDQLQVDKEFSLIYKLEFNPQKINVC